MEGGGISILRYCYFRQLDINRYVHIRGSINKFLKATSLLDLIITLRHIARGGRDKWRKGAIFIQLSRNASNAVYFTLITHCYEVIKVPRPSTTHKYDVHLYYLAGNCEQIFQAFLRLKHQAWRASHHSLILPSSFVEQRRVPGLLPHLSR